MNYEFMNYRAHKTKLGDGAFSLTVLAIWNALLESVRNTPSTDYFKGHLRTQYLSTYMPFCHGMCFKVVVHICKTLHTSKQYISIFCYVPICLRVLCILIASTTFKCRSKTQTVVDAATTMPQQKPRITSRHSRENSPSLTAFNSFAAVGDFS